MTSEPREGVTPARQEIDGAEAAKRYADGVPIHAIAASLNRSYRAVRRALLAQGVVLRPRGQLSRLGSFVPELISAYKAGVPIPELSETYKCSQAALEDFFKAQGIRRPPATGTEA